VEEDDWLLLTKDAPARCSRWSQVCCPLSLLVLGAVTDETGNGGPLVGRYFSSISHVARREGWLLLILLLRLRKGVASAGSTTAPEEGYGCGGGYSWVSGSARFWLLLVLAMVHQRSCWDFSRQAGLRFWYCSVLLSVEGLRKRKRDLVVASGFECYQTGLS